MGNEVFSSVLRLTGLTICLALSVLLAGSLALGSKSWMFDGHLFSCPKDWTYSGRFVDGKYCTLTAVENAKIGNWNLESRACSFNGDETVTCRFNDPCNRVCLTEGGKPCPGEISKLSSGTCSIELGQNDIFFLPCGNVKVEAFCDSAFGVSVGKLFVLRAVMLGTILIACLWIATEILLRKAARKANSERSEGMIRQAEFLPSMKVSYRRLLDQLWYEEAKFRRQYAETIRTINTFNNSISPLQSRDPRKRFQASAWLRRLDMYRELRNQKEFEFRTRGLLRSLFLNCLFLAVLVGGLWAVIKLFPAQLFVKAGAFFWPMSSWLDFLILVDVFFEFVLFFAACACRSWPRTALPKQAVNDFESVVEDTSPKSALSLEEGAASESVITLSESGMREFGEICLLIACHESCLTDEKEMSFRATLEAALRVFPADQIFVCDNGNSLAPLDATWDVTRAVDPRINYVYVPEGNKTFAFYWVNKYWIPFLVESGQTREFRYAVMIDDDVRLPSDLVLPEDFLMVHPEIKAVHFPLTAMPGDSMLSEFQDIEYKMAAAHKYLQSGLGRVLACHGAISLWERKCLDEVLLEHDTVFHGEDLYAGLILLRMRDQSRIISIPSTPVFTQAPEAWLDLFRQRVKSWDLTSHKKTFSFLVELVSPISFFHLYSLVLKPYFLLESVSIVLDWIRVFLAVTLLFKNPASVGISLAIFFSVLYLQIALHQFVFLRNQPALRASLASTLLFPLYKVALSFFRIAALCQNVLVYSHDRKSLKIATREDEVHDIPPVPPHFLVDWFSVWSASLPPKPDSASRATTRTASLY